MVCRPKPYDRKNSLSAAKNMCIRIICSFILMAAFNAHADTVDYFLDNVILYDHTQMTGTFTWTYDAGDFENGVGQFTSLVIPHTSHDHTDLNATFDIGKTIEITLGGNGFHTGVFLSGIISPHTGGEVIFEDGFGTSFLASSARANPE